MPLRRLVILALLAGAVGAFVGALLRPRARAHPVGAAQDQPAEEQPAPMRPSHPASRPDETPVDLREAGLARHAATEAAG
jgi:hypothetical protein